MALISITRLRIRSVLYLPRFFFDNELAVRQLTRTPGFIQGRLLADSRRAFWTMTAWEDEAAMRAYRNSGAHRKVMPKLLKWCDEAMVAHWSQETSELPGWAEAHRRMLSEGRLSRVNSPSPDHAAKNLPAPKVGRFIREVRPALKGGTETGPSNGRA